MMEKKQTRADSFMIPCLLVLLQGVLYGLGDPVSKEAYDVMPVYSLLSVRYWMALAVLLIFAGKRIVKGLKGCAFSDWFLPSFCMGGAYLTGNIALGLTSATSVAFLRSLSTVMTPLLAFLIYKRKPGLKHIPVLIMVVAGLYLLCGWGGLSGFGAGEMAAFLCALLLAGSLVFGERALDRVEPVTLSALQTAVSAVMASICAAAFDGGVHLEAVTPKVGCIIAYLAIGCTIAGYILQNVALMKIPSRTVALLQCFCPVLTAFFSRLILGERLSAAGMAGAVIILVCVIAETFLKDENVSEKQMSY